MPYIRTVPPEEATGLLRKLFDEAVRRAGKVFNVLRIQSVRPHVLDATVKLYAEVMHSPRGPLSRVQREMVATVVSRVNQCHYWTLAHADDLRVEIAKTAGEELADSTARAVMRDYTTAPIDARDRAMLDFAVLLTRSPAQVTRADVELLRAAGFDDVAIHDLVHVTALFNYFVRVADGLGIEDEPDWAERGWDW